MRKQEDRSQTAKAFRVVLSLKALEDAEACRSGTDFFKAIVASQGRKHSASIEWGPLAQLYAAANNDQGFFSWAQDYGLLPPYCLTNEVFDQIDLSHLDIRRARFGGSRFGGSRFFGCDMRGMNCSYSDLESVTLERCDAHGFTAINIWASYLRARLCTFSSVSFACADLTVAEFVGCDLRDARFGQANLRSARFSSCDLRGARFYAANLEGASFYQCKFDQIPDGADGNAEYHSCVFEDR